MIRAASEMKTKDVVSIPKSSGTSSGGTQDGETEGSEGKEGKNPRNAEIRRRDSLDISRIAQRLLWWSANLRVATAENPSQCHTRATKYLCGSGFCRFASVGQRGMHQ